MKDSASALPHHRVEALHARVAAMGPPTSAEGLMLQAWLETAAKAKAAPPESGREGGARAALSRLLAAAHTLLWATLGRLSVRVSPSARRHLVEMLSQRLTPACVQVLASEQQALDALAARPGEGVSLDASALAWLERFEAHPVLARVMTRVLLDWRAHVEQLLTRLSKDRSLLGSTLLRGAPPRVLTGVRGDLGDAHAGGRSVAVLELDEGAHVVYKPKDLRITHQVQRLCAFLNGRGLPLPLHVREVLCREGYTWEEFVPAAPCHSVSEIERFYVRMGMFARLFQLLEARDLWLDNVVAAGEHPVFVDLEMVLQPRRREAAETAALGRAREWLHESVAWLGLLAAPLPIAPGVPGEDVGALTPPRAFLHPLRHVPALAALAGDPRPSRDGHVLWTREGYAPTLEGVPARAVEFLEPLVEGYRAMHACLRANAPELLGPEGALAHMAGLPVRYIHRDTWTCYRLIRAGLTPDRLTRPEHREATFDSLLRAAEAHPEPEAERAAVVLEREALLHLDVPYFLCHTDGEDLLEPGGARVWRGFFEGEALTRARRRLETVETFPLARQEALVRSTFATGRHAPRRLEPLRSGAGPEPDWRKEAVAIGDKLLEEALSAEGGLAWVGVTYQPLHELRRLEVLPAELLTGSSGVALVLAELYRATGLERFRDAAWAALEPTQKGVWPQSSQEVGAFRGLGAHLFVLRRCATCLDAPHLEALARTRLAALLREDLLAHAPLDAVSGVTGLLLVALALEERSAAGDLVDLLERRLAEGPLAPAAPRLLDSLPSLSEGLKLCAVRVERQLGRRPRWAGHSEASRSCTGALLTRLAVARETGIVEDAARSAVLRTLEEAPRTESSSARWDAVELALEAARTWEELGEHARRLGADLLAARRDTGRWFPDRLEADEHCLSALWGLPAVAYTLLRLSDARLPSLRLVSSHG